MHSENAKIVYNFGLSECNWVKRKSFMLSKDIKIAFLLYILIFYVPPQKVAGYYGIPSELLCFRPSVHPSAVDHSCPLHNFDIVGDNFTKLGTNLKA